MQSFDDVALELRRNAKFGRGEVADGEIADRLAARAQLADLARDLEDLGADEMLRERGEAVCFGCIDRLRHDFSRPVTCHLILYARRIFQRSASARMKSRDFTFEPA